MAIHAFISTERGNMPVDFPERGKDFCHDCQDELYITELHSARRYDSIHRSMVDVLLCEACAPKCGWSMNGHNFCTHIAMPGSEGGWCEFHDAMAEAEIAREEASNESK